jgi:hypothetical protein
MSTPTVTVVLGLRPFGGYKRKHQFVVVSSREWGVKFVVLGPPRLFSTAASSGWTPSDGRSGYATISRQLQINPFLLLQPSTYPPSVIVSPSTPFR